MNQTHIRPYTGPQRPHEDQPAFEWECPTCGRTIYAMKSEDATPEEIAADGRCYSCRENGVFEVPDLVWSIRARSGDELS